MNCLEKDDKKKEGVSRRGAGVFYYADKNLPTSEAGVSSRCYTRALIHLRRDGAEMRRALGVRQTRRAFG